MLGGRAPDAEWLRGFVDANDPDVWAVDSGVASCRAIGRVPSRIIGDRDSASPGDWIWALEGGAEEYLHRRDKDLTDFQLALKLFMDAPGQRDSNAEDDRILILSGCFGGRTDHLMSALLTFALSDGAEGSLSSSPSLSNSSSLSRSPCSSPSPHAPRGGVSRCMMDETEGIIFIYPRRGVSMKFHAAPVAVSLLPMSDVCEGVNLSGVRWPLSGAALRRSFPWAISNETADCPDCLVTASCEDGVLALCWCYEGL
jgi:thiamine pyrophosphokinase